MTFSEQIVYGMFRPGKYKELLDLKKGRSVAYVIVMMLVLGIVGFLIPVSATVAGFGGFTELFEKKMAPITYEEGTMSIERPFSLNLGTVKVVINTEKDHVTEERVKAPGAYVAFGAKFVNLYISAGGKVDDFGGYKLTDIFPPRLDNQTLVRAVPYIYVIYEAAQGDTARAVAAWNRSYAVQAVPYWVSFAVLGVTSTGGWIAIILKGVLPLKKVWVLAAPLLIAGIGFLLEWSLPLPFNGFSSGFESLGWIIMFIGGIQAVKKG